MKELQKLTGCIAALQRFMPRSADKCLPFFKVLKKKACFGWDEEAKQALKNLEEYLGRLPRTVSPATGEPLLAYLIVSGHAERDRQQLPVYYVSHVLAWVEQCYLFIEKFTYALLIANKKLRPCFKSHHIIALTNQPLRNTLTKYENSEKMLK